MRVVAAKLRDLAFPLDGRGAAAGRTERRGVIVEVRTDTGLAGRGEASPLPGMSRDTLDEARAALAAFAARLPFEVADRDDIFAIARSLAAPSARFAIETALLDVLARTRDTTIAQLLVSRPSTIATSVVVDTIEEARRAIAAGHRVLKMKVREPIRAAVPSPEGDPDGETGFGDIVRNVERIATAARGMTLRLDANRSWPRADVRERLDALAEIARRHDVTIEYVEEPCIDLHELLAEVPLPLPIALDESLVELSPAQLDRALASAALGAIVLKPTLLGGSGTCLALAEHARAAGVAVVVTHALEGPIGAAACTELARAIGGDRAHGVGVDSGHAHEDTTELESVAGEMHAERLVAAAGVEVLVAMPARHTIDRLRDALDARRPIALLHHALPAAELARQRAMVEAARLAPGDLVLFTSGSTGQARGVVLSRAAIEAAATASAAHLGWRDDDRWLLALSTAHAGGAAVVARCHLAGKPIELLEDWDRASAFGALERCTLASLVPTQLADLLAEPAWRPSPRLRAVLLGGAAASPALLEAAAARGVPFLATYGMTESFGQLATAPRERAGDPRAPLVPLHGVEISAGTRDAPAPIRVRGPMLATRYLDGRPIAPEHVTSDLGFVDGGLHVVGRADDMIITGGENVSPATVEAVLAATPGVRAACAFGIPDETWGQIVGAAIAAERLDDAALAAWHAALPAHARPRELALVRELPMLATGKLDRRAAARLPRARVRY